MIHKCLSNGCTFDDESSHVFIVCPVCGYDMDGSVPDPQNVVLDIIDDIITQPVDNHEPEITG